MHSSRKNARQACDACRQRRIKCEASDEQKPSPHSICKRCLGAALRCTFNMPVKRRGPPAKRRQTFFGESDRNEIESYATPDMPQASEGIFQTMSPKDAAPTGSLWQDRPNIDQFCSEALLDAFTQAYMSMVYPNIPVVHLPTFEADLRAKRYRTDQDFFGFLISICAAVVALLPDRFASYKKLDPNFAPSSRLETVEYVQSLLNQLKQPNHYDRPNFEKWGSALLLGWAFGYLGLRKRLFFCLSEARAFMTDMKFHRIRSYVRLNNIETQLRKKAFWLTAMTHIHLRPENVTWDSLSDRFLFNDTDTFELLPINVDDEYIKADKILGQPSEQPALAMGFNALIRVNSCLVLMKKDLSPPPFQTTNLEELPRDFFGSCDCGKYVVPTPLSQSLQARLENLDKIPAELPPPMSIDAQEHQSAFPPWKAFQYESMRANIHVTHRWVQSLLIERMIALSEVAFADRMQLWRLQSDVSEKLLGLLQALPQSVLASHGLLLSFKIRQVAAVLLDHPYDAGTADAERASQSIRAFAKILGQLDEKYAQN